MGFTSYWQMQANLNGCMQLPGTNQRPGFVIWSPAGRLVILLELTVLWEDIKN